ALASRSTAIGGSAMLRACQALRRQVAEVAAGLIGCAEEALRFGEGAITSKDTSVTLSWADVARHALSAPSGGIEEAALTESVVYHADGEAWSSGICLAVVGIDRETGTPKIEKFFWVDDAGVVVNPLMVHGQLVGGLAQGLGEALMERIVYDGDGQLLTGSFMDYALPRAGDMPASIEIDKLETPARTNPLGAKGVGEAGCIGVPAALYNAVRDALAPFRPCDLQMPLTSEKIWRVLQQGEAPRPGDRG
ncbi:xanthine dehydrogenase family protein molybdopterin-binding subunit, partial [Nitratireductor sp. GCM10026969]|uniref:xanthine dehydrogenase family protein molybdopterin-binding subunit n=1 Tax=Nitratireductor sp. GCM10026969 TaxID=3252645 RepID=UPI003605B14A